MAAAHDVPTSATVLLPHASSSVRTARRKLAEALAESHVASTVADDAVLILSELLSNALRHARPLASGDVRVAWRLAPDGLLEVEVTDGGGPTRPQQSTPSISARGGRGLDIISALAGDWGVRVSPTETTVWAVLAVRARHARRDQDAPEPDDAAAAEPRPGSPTWSGAAGGGRPARQTTRMPTHRAGAEPGDGADSASPPRSQARSVGSTGPRVDGGLGGPEDPVAPIRRPRVVGE
jgi:anti-sigma regulatory factor (Ser/Thr protein kinase)